MSKLDREQDIEISESQEQSLDQKIETPVDLEDLSTSLRDELLSSDEQEQLFLHDTAEQVAHFSGEEIEAVLAKNEALDIKAEKIQAEALTRLKAIITAAKEKPSSLDSLEKRNLNTTYQEVPEKEAEIRLKKIPAEMQQALNVCGRVFKNCEYPWAMIGSNALVLEANTEKKGDDLDIIFAIQDLPVIYQKLESLEAAGLVSNFKVTEMQDLSGEPNSCFKLSGQVQTSERLIDFEAFAQNIDPEKSSNGLINIGLDKHKVNIYQIPDTEGEVAPVNMIDKEGVEKLYKQNFLNEFGLFELEGWQNRGFLNNKSIQRLANLQNLGYTPDQIIVLLAETEVKTEEATEAKRAISNLFNKFKKGNYQGSGLTESLGDKLDIPDNYHRHEKVVDFITKETSRQMQTISEIVNLAAEKEKLALSADQGNLEEYYSFLESQVLQLASIRDQYHDYLSLCSNEDVNQDFALFAALSRLKDYFAQPALNQLLVKRLAVEEKLISLKK